MVHFIVEQSVAQLTRSHAHFVMLASVIKNVTFQIMFEAIYSFNYFYQRNSTLKLYEQ